MAEGRGAGFRHEELTKGQFHQHRVVWSTDVCEDQRSGRTRLATVLLCEVNRWCWPLRATTGDGAEVDAACRLVKKRHTLLPQGAGIRLARYRRASEATGIAVAERQVVLLRHRHHRATMPLVWHIIAGSNKSDWGEDRRSTLATKFRHSFAEDEVLTGCAP